MVEEMTSEKADFLPKVLEVLSDHPKGASTEVLLELVPFLTKELLVPVLNKLLTQHKVELLRKGNQLVYKLIQDSGSGQKYQGTDVEEKIIFDAVGRAGNNGVTNKDLKTHCHLPIVQINKILKSLESKRLIKCITASSRKKIFILFDLEPSQNVTGGIFYNGQEFESEFVDVLGDQCYRYLLQANGLADKLSDPIAQRNASYKSSKDICNYINGLQISKVKLSLKDVEAILETLVYDDKVQKSVSMSNSYSSKDSGKENLYKVTKPLISSGGFMMVPCGVCKVHQHCHEGGEISPATCEYMRQWLDF